MTPLLVSLVAILAASPADAFAPGRSVVAKPRLAPTPLLATRADLYRADLSAKEFQLEELEDKEESETELWLNADGTVTLGRTNGPPVKDFKGDWHVLETAGEGDKPFRMRLTRSYESPSSGTSNLGDVSYDIHREFWGNVEMVGDSISVSGRVHGPIPSGNEYVDEQSVLESELGYFTLIDAVASEGVEGERGLSS
ncbi:hypothetical protein ACHAXT_009676 [Thalassiosira profunda]